MGFGEEWGLGGLIENELNIHDLHCFVSRVHEYAWDHAEISICRVVDLEPAHLFPLVFPYTRFSIEGSDFNLIENAFRAKSLNRLARGSLMHRYSVW